MSSHVKRILTSLLLLLLLVYLLFWAPRLYWALAVYALSALGLLEFYSLFWPGKDRAWLKAAGILLAAPVVLHSLAGVSAIAGLLFGLWLINVVFLIQMVRGGQGDWQGLQLVSLGLVYIAGGLHFLPKLAAEEVIFVLAAAFSTDILAYYCGSRWGERRMWPAVSPKKTWMGAVGGLVGCLLVCLLLGLFLGSAAWFVWLAVGLGLNIAAQVGDLFISALKRRQQVKDSGRLLPGHGGILDRFDSVLLAVPVYMLFQTIYPLF